MPRPLTLHTGKADKHTPIICQWRDNNSYDRPPAGPGPRWNFAVSARARTEVRAVPGQVAVRELRPAVRGLVGREWKCVGQRARSVDGNCVVGIWLT